MKYEHCFERSNGKIVSYRLWENLEDAKNFIKANLMNNGSYPQIVKNQYGKVVFETRNMKVIVGLNKPKRVRSFNGLPGFECNVRRVTYVCDGEGINPKGTELNAFVMNKNDINAYLVYVPKQDGYPWKAFLMCKEMGDGKYTADRDLKAVVI